jgi:hypothetical protein
VAHVGQPKPGEEQMMLSAHKLLFLAIVLAILLGVGWVLIVYVLSFSAAQWIIDRIDAGHAPRRRRAQSGDVFARVSRAGFSTR